MIAPLRTHLCSDSNWEHSTALDLFPWGCAKKKKTKNDFQRKMFRGEKWTKMRGEKVDRWARSIQVVYLACGEQEFYKAVSLHGAESAFLSCAQMTAWGKHLVVIIRGWKKKQFAVMCSANSASRLQQLLALFMKLSLLATSRLVNSVRLLIHIQRGQQRQAWRGLSAALTVKRQSAFTCNYRICRVRLKIHHRRSFFYPAFHSLWLEVLNLARQPKGPIGGWHPSYQRHFQSVLKRVGPTTRFRSLYV